MKNGIKALILIMLILAVTVVMPGFTDSTTKAADEAEWSEEWDASEENAYTIVEIVPYVGMAEIGYLIGGQEPVDEELIPYNSSAGVFSFLGDAISLYPSYKESELSPTGSVQTGWSPARTYVTQNGYFEDTGASGAGLYRMETGHTVYVPVPEGTGDYRASLPAGVELENVYQYASNPINRKNVKAYFVYGNTGGQQLYSSTLGYIPYSVTENPDGTGDYDYDSENKRFILNKGSGKFDVLFIRSNGANLYYMLADYEIVEDNSGDYSYSGTLDYSSQSGGNYRQYTNAPIFTYEQYWGGTYRWVQDDTALSKPSNFYQEGGRIWVRGQRILHNYQYTYETELVNNEWFKRISLGVPAEYIADFPVRVITITPNELNQAANQHYIDEADLFYINANYNHNSNYIMMYESYTYEGQQLTAGQRYYNNNTRMRNDLNFARNDLNWPTVDKMFRKIAGIGCYKASVIMDSTFYTDAINGTGVYGNYDRSVNVGVNYNNNNATGCNMAKLYIMITQRNMIDFYNSFMNPDTAPAAYRITQQNVNTNNVSSTGTTGIFTRGGRYNATSNQARFWNGNTFLPYGLNEDGNMEQFDWWELYDMGIVNSNLTANTTDLTNNVLIVGGQGIFTSSFTQNLYIPADARDDAVEHLNSLDPDNPVDPNQISLGDFLNVVTNNGNGYEETGGVSYPGGSDVEGPAEEPSDPGSGGDEGGNNRTYKRILNIQPTADFSASVTAITNMLSDYDIQIVNMTSIQFNGSIEDINSRYDMIYMGSSAGRFYMQNNRTVFNNGDLDNYVYISPGDRVTQMNLSTLTSVGNDIITYKISMLEAYLNAGYPVVLDTNLYNMTDSGGRNIVMNGTNIRTFITNSKGRNNFLTMTDYNNGGTSRTNFLNKIQSMLDITRPVIELIQPLVSDMVPVDTLTIKFKLLPKRNRPSYYTYNASIFVDENMNGIFEESEKKSPVSGDGSTWDGIRESRNRIYVYQYDMSDLNGVYQWKILIERSDNPEIRGYVTGYAVNSNPETIKILHIRDNSSTYDLNVFPQDTSKLINTYAGSGKLMDYELAFVSMTVNQFAANYQGKAYDPADPEGTSQLSDYHLLILDNPSNTIDNGNGALSNIKDEITNKNLGVVFTKNALGYGNQGSYFESDRFSFANTNTFNYMNRNILALWIWVLQQYIFRNMEGDLSDDLLSDTAYQSGFLTKVNEGSITRYPYPINDAIRTVRNSYSNHVTADFSDTSPLIGWYGLSDSGSPMVTEAGLDSTPIGRYIGTYSSSPNDVKNNYYLFSNGACFYSGIELSRADAAGNDDEMKLFVNTLIAAYKASKRVTSKPPVIEIIDPEAVPDELGRPSITVTPDDLTGNDLIVTFEISESSSNMDLEILLDGEEPDGVWDDRIYESVGGVLGPEIAIDNEDKVVEKKTYAVKIPADRIEGTHTLTLRARNEQGNTGTAEVIITYIRPPVVEIEDPKPDSNDTSQYIYVDIDYTGLSSDGEYMDAAEEMRIVFSVSEAMSEVLLKVSSEGTDLSAAEYSIFAYDGTVETGPLDLTLAYPGETEELYVLYLPMSLMTDRNSREFTITATDEYNVSGAASFTLLRRSLFPLD